MRRIACFLCLLSLTLGGNVAAQSFTESAVEQLALDFLDGEFLDQRSLLSLTTFDLFDDRFDRAQEPSSLAALERRHFWADVSSLGDGVGRLATVQPLGPGNLAFLVRYGRDDHFDGRNAVLDSVKGVNFDDVVDEIHYRNAYVGYGWNATQKVTFGLGYVHSRPRWEESGLTSDRITESSTIGVLPITWPIGCTFPTCEGEETSGNEAGSRINVDRDGGIFEVQYDSGKAVRLRGRALYSRERAGAVSWDGNHLLSMHDEFSGGASVFYTDEAETEQQEWDYGIDGNRWGVLLDLQHLAGDRFEHDVEAGFGRYHGDFANDFFRDRMTMSTEIGELGLGRLDADPERTDEVSDFLFRDSEGDGRHDHLYVRYRARWKFKRASVSAGVRYDGHDAKADRSGSWTDTMTITFNDGDGVTVGDPDDFVYLLRTTGTWIRDHRLDMYTLRVPVAVVISLSPKVDLRLGAEYGMTDWRLKEDNLFVGSDAFTEILTRGDGTVVDTSFGGTITTTATLSSILGLSGPGTISRVDTDDVDWSAGLLLNPNRLLNIEISVMDEDQSVGFPGNGPRGSGVVVQGGVTISWD